MSFALLQAAGCEADGIPDAPRLEKQLAAGLNCPLSSGMGRLFDGAAAILGIKEVCNYESVSRWASCRMKRKRACFASTGGR